MERNPSAWQMVDPERIARLQRAVNVSTAGSYLLQTYINKVIQQLTLRELGLQAVLDRKPGIGNAAYVNRRAAGTTGGEWVADTDSSREETGTYTQPSFTYRTLLTKGRVTRKVQATGRNYTDVLAAELEGKSEDFANRLDEGCVTGNYAADANQINGILTLVNGVGTQTVANTTATLGDSLTIAKLDAAIDKVKGNGARSDLVIVGSLAGCRTLNAALVAQKAINDMVNVAAGFRVRSYDGIPIVPDTNMPDTLVWNGSSSVTAFTGGTTTALAIVNRRFVWLEELTPTTVMPLARSTSQYDEFEMFWDGALVLGNTLGASLLAGILPG